MLAPNLLTYPGSIICIDPKSELCSITADYRRRMGQTVHILEPFGPLNNAQFNPMDTLLESDDLIADAGLIAGALVVPVPGVQDDHWNSSAQQAIQTLVLHVGTSPVFKGRRNLVEVYRLLFQMLEPSGNNDGTFAVQNEMMANVCAGGAVRQGARDFYERADRERDSVLSTARRHLSFLAYEKIQKSLSGSSFDLRDLKRKRMTIYLSLPAMRMSTCARWLRIFVSLTLAAMEKERTRPEHAVLLMLDEFPVLGTMKTLEDAAGLISGLGCRMVFVAQDLGQIKSLYAERWETFLGNSGVLSFFGNSDLSTIEWVARRLGTTGITNSSQSNIAYDAAVKGGTGQSWSSSTAELLTAAEVARLFGRDDELLRQLIIRPGGRPIVLQRAFYDKHELFAGKFNDPEGR